MHKCDRQLYIKSINHTAWRSSNGENPLHFKRRNSLKKYENTTITLLFKLNGEIQIQAPRGKNWPSNK
jgi:hypothetical protein